MIRGLRVAFGAAVGVMLAAALGVLGFLLLVSAGLNKVTGGNQLDDYPTTTAPGFVSGEADLSDEPTTGLPPRVFDGVTHEWCLPRSGEAPATFEVTMPDGRGRCTVQ